uniref:Calx-beta domain-containing protein n=1 Tax=Mucochytrium quahogii TaxID=96639 RepID=A0A7S2SLZ4_9STRA|mmetsp:Transcript_802/g.1546  ORF Transcript_802/g.1546 Transcript_802/m.1546 type:complete len:722 (+) Transcript_802:3-2168(+)
MNQPPEDGLGPSTIVGSAAFNLLCITAVCVIAIPDGEKREIEEFGVFGITGVFSVFAYVWLFIVINDEIVTIPEALITLFMFPFLVVCAYAQSKNWFGLCGGNETQVRPEAHVVNGKSAGEGPHLTKNGVKTFADQQKQQLADILQKLPEDMDDEEKAKLAAAGIQQNKPQSRMKHRINAMRRIAGGKRIIQKKINFVKNATVKRLSVTPEPPNEPQEIASVPEENPFKDCPKVQFLHPAHSVSESVGFFAVPIQRIGTEEQLSKKTTVYFETLELEDKTKSAKSGEDYEYVIEKVVFEPNETEKCVNIKIIDDSEFENNESFLCVLTTRGADHNANLKEPENVNVTEITIIDDDHPGTFAFEEAVRVVRETDGWITVNIRRTAGCSGRVKLAYKTKESTAKAGEHFHEVQGTLVFEHGENEAQYQIHIEDQKSYDKDLTFSTSFEIIGHPDCGAQYGEHRVLSITITNDENYSATVDQISKLMQMHLESLDVGSESWSEQLVQALTVQGEDGGPPTMFDNIMHILTFGWKVLFALVPPTSYLGGWVSFVVSICFIGLLTMAVGDLAALFGCCLGVPNPLTAITFVALGTSLPDTFASKTAAENDENADASITNITGSNSVNVFLGLGLPWTIASIVRSVSPLEGVPEGEEYLYKVKAGTLSYSVVVFCSVAAVYFILMLSRRFLGFGELGGPKIPKIASSILLVLLWVTYVALSGIKALE